MSGKVEKDVSTPATYLLSKSSLRQSKGSIHQGRLVQLVSGILDKRRIVTHRLNPCQESRVVHI